MSRVLVLSNAPQPSLFKRGEPSGSGWLPSGWIMGKANWSKKNAQKGRDAARHDKAKDRQEKARLKKDRQRNGNYCFSDADDREFEAQAGHISSKHSAC